ncbi:unnamed protein product [Brachionus calyciflorus]|uniref:Uncharacterized protein n=1 Tax=Brachionus calyciflorus TaxID=104777 RepID=A0A813M356_9BILA|nr:unnamed protein product [Brachionus calyciflorus]
MSKLLISLSNLYKLKWRLRANISCLFQIYSEMPSLDKEEFLRAFLKLVILFGSSEILILKYLPIKARSEDKELGVDST